MERYGIDLIVVGQHVPSVEIGLRHAHPSRKDLIELLVGEPQFGTRDLYGDTPLKRARALSLNGGNADEQQGQNPDFFHGNYRFFGLIIGF